MLDDHAACYRAVASRDPRFDGWFFYGVTSTGIYCRPSCPATTPKPENVRLFPTAAAAQVAGFRSCRRCRPDATPGSPQWASRADVVARAMRGIADGVVDREGVRGLARQVGYSERQLNRLLTVEVGAGPLGLARAQRAQTARILIETTSLPMADVAFASGFSSVRQFNDTVRDVYAATPSTLRAGAHGPRGGEPGHLLLRLPYRAPDHTDRTLAFLGARAVPGVEHYDGVTYRRTMRLPHGPGTVALRAAKGHVACTVRLDDLRDLTTAVARCRRLLDLDADPEAVAAVLCADPVLGRAVRRAPGRRVPGTVDGAELAVRALLGQQVSVAGARTTTGRLVRQLGEPLPRADGELTHLFPEVRAIADGDHDALGMPQARKAALRQLARALADCEVTLHPGADRAEATARLRRLPGIGPWTAGYVALRALGDPDVLLASDLGVRKGWANLGIPGAPDPTSGHADRWRPWRSYATLHLWAVAARKDSL